MNQPLDRALFWLRWLFLAGAVLLAWQGGETIIGADGVDETRLAVGAGVAAGANLLLGILALAPGTGRRVLGTLGLLLDCTVAALFFWVYDGALVALLILGTVAIFAGAYRFRWVGVLFGTALLAAGSGVTLWQLDQTAQDPVVIWVVSLALIASFGVLAVVLQSGGMHSGSSPGALAERLTEAQRLRVTRERARAIYEMANTLSATLDHQRILETAQMIGTLNLRDDLGDDAHLISMVLLFQGEDNRLRVVASRGLTPRDHQVALPGRRGVLGLALKQSEPVFGPDASHDPELRYMVAFQAVKSVLAIPLAAGLDNYGVMAFGCDQPNAFTDDHIEMMTAIGKQSTISLQNAVLYQNLLVEKEKIVEVEESARKKLARDLHDGPTQSVAAIAMRVNYIRRLVERQPQQAMEELWKVEELARRTTKEIRHMLFTLRPLVLETKGLVAALNQLSEKMLETHDTKVTINAQPDIAELLDTNQQGVLFYIVEEAVNNARKHAHAEEIAVRLYRRQTFVLTEIEDNGRGFDVSLIDNNYEQRGSLGMVNMRERAELIEGTLRIQSALGRGTKISILVPISESGMIDVAQDAATPLTTMQSQRQGAQGDSQVRRPDARASQPQPPPARDSRVRRLDPSPSQPHPPAARDSRVRRPDS